MTELLTYIPQEEEYREFVTGADDTIKEANEIANTAFGDDYKHDIDLLLEEFNHAEGCGCLTCKNNYMVHVFDVARKYTPPIE